MNTLWPEWQRRRLLMHESVRLLASLGAADDKALWPLGQQPRRQRIRELRGKARQRYDRRLAELTRFERRNAL